MSQRLSVFISSTSKDLETYREGVADTVVSLNMFPITMKGFHPTSDNPVQLSYDKVQEADIFVGIYAYRYGYAPDSSLSYKTINDETRIPDGKIGITHLEYEWAIERGIPILLYVIKDNQQSRSQWAGTFEDDIDQAAMASFKEIILKQHVVGFFDTSDNLTGQVAIALSQLRNDHRVAVAERLEVEERLLQLVETWWIKGALETSLHDQLQIDLDFSVKTSNPFADNYNNPTISETEMIKQSNLMETFNRFGQRLLILGSPGSGKTITLLNIARTLIEGARQNAKNRIPVVLNLSSWQERLSIDGWIVVELVSKYNIPGSDAQNWVSNNRLICLLDGLDEVEAKHRLKCLDAINDYITGFDANVIVCSRQIEYDALSTNLKIAGSVLVQALTIEDVNQYLRDIKGDFEELQISLANDATFRAIVLNPLMLYIAIITHKNMSATELIKLNSEADWYTYLFNTYASKILERKSDTEHREILTNLEWLAGKLMRQSHSIFYVDQINLEMLDNPNLKRIIQAITWALYGSVAVLTLILALAVGYDLSYGGLWYVPAVVSIPSASGIWLITWASAGLLVSRLSPEQVEIIISRKWSAEKVNDNIISGILRGILWGIITGVIPSIPFLIISYVGYSLLGIHLFTIGVIALGISILLFAIQLLVTLQRIRGFGLLGGIIAGVVGGIVFALVAEFYASFFPVAEAIQEVLGTSIPFRLMAYSLPASVALGLGAGITRTWVYVLRIGLNVTRADENSVVMAPTLKQTTQNARIFSIIFAIAGGISGILVAIMVLISANIAGAFPNRGIIWTILGLPFPLVVGFGASIIFAMSALREFGGLVALQHIMVRKALQSQNIIPGDYDKFLDDLVKLRLMHKVGIGYRFFHHLFQEHLAEGKAQKIYRQ